MFQRYKEEMYVWEEVLRRPIIKCIQTLRLEMTLKENIPQFGLESTITARVRPSFFCFPRSSPRRFCPPVSLLASQLRPRPSLCTATAAYLTQ